MKQDISPHPLYIGFFRSVSIMREPNHLTQLVKEVIRIESSVGEQLQGYLLGFRIGRHSTNVKGSVKFGVKFFQTK
jgi:hypothetical protein